MTLLLDQSGSPGIHALIIGVGRYSHCGSTASDPLLRAFGDLTSPPLSAVAVAQLLLRLGEPPGLAPLRSLELLASPLADPATLPAGWAPTPPTFEAIRTAYQGWRLRGDRSKAETLLFFFCGHGIQRASMILLPEDFGAVPNNPFDTSIDISSSRLGTAPCLARTQVWLVDACRELPEGAKHIVDPKGRKLAEPTTDGQLGLDSTFLASTGDFQRAGALPNRPSRFTGALLEALGGLAAKWDNGRWRIGTGQLQGAINQLLAAESELMQWSEQFCNYMSGTGVGHLWDVDPPNVPTTIDCSPASRHQDVTLQLLSDDGVVKHERAPAKGAWRITERPGSYNLRANSDLPDVAQATELWVLPPVTRHQLTWRETP
jgi:hypothetical protein